MNESLAKAAELMSKYDYSETEIAQVQEAILFHSCRGQNLPRTEEGKILATADALAHLLSDFYLELPFYGWLTAAKEFDTYKQWVLQKIEKDLSKKIFYEEYRTLARPRYEAMKAVFSSGESWQRK